ncbi:CoA transferase [uncultured Tateyamaria sp.]|uniref:CoA transferase n=1 Tax=uncultured Tateyamaria sp. TaxID=455651 RepID=UPI002617C064|nr:CoA transferase [uncultured Tateyamaria sp.]
MDLFISQIDQALGPNPDTPEVHVQQGRNAELPSCFAVTDLAFASVRAAAVELAALGGAPEVTIDRRLTAMWFDMTLRPTGWALPSAWDAIAGVYKCADGWIRLHTNAPHHRDAALAVLSCPADKASVADAVADWRKSDLEDAIVQAHGAAAAMYDMAEWAAHPQGRAVADAPLIAWSAREAQAAPVALAGLKVLDLTRVLAGPVTTRFLAGFGADVLRIDPPWWGEPGVEPEVTLGKRRAGLDLNHPADRAEFEALLAEADVLVHGYRPGALDGLGYGPDRLHTLAPHLIEVSLCAYGWHGPWAGRRGFDSLVQMSCGIAAEGMRRTKAAHPVPLPVQALDHATGYLMAAAVLRAIRVRNTSGQIRSARLSLARTAALLTATGPRDMEGKKIIETPDDLAPGVEHTDWGPARRLKFPIRLGDVGPSWLYPAGLLRKDVARW